MMTTTVWCKDPQTCKDLPCKILEPLRALKCLLFRNLGGGRVWCLSWGGVLEALWTARYLVIHGLFFVALHAWKCESRRAQLLVVWGRGSRLPRPFAAGLSKALLEEMQNLMASSWGPEAAVYCWGVQERPICGPIFLI